MHADLPTLFAFNRWASGKMLDACRRLSPERYAAGPVPGWSPVRTTVWHIAAVTNFWLRTLAKDPDQSFPQETEVATADAAARLLDRAYGTFASLFPRLTPEPRATPRTFQGRGWSVGMPPWAALWHVVNHTTYHRGQIASKLKRFGVRQAETDLAFFMMEHAPQTPGPKP